MVKYDETSGLKGLKQISEHLYARDDITDKQKDEIFEHYSFNYLNRLYPGWMRK